MNGLEALGFGRGRPRRDERVTSEFVQRQWPLRRILSFTRRSIDDVVNNPIARHEVIGYYKLYRQINRRAEMVDLERQWNPLGR